MTLFSASYRLSSGIHDPLLTPEDFENIVSGNMRPYKDQDGRGPNGLIYSREFASGRPANDSKEIDRCRKCVFVERVRKLINKTDDFDPDSAFTETFEEILYW